MPQPQTTSAAYHPNKCNRRCSGCFTPPENHPGYAVINSQRTASGYYRFYHRAERAAAAIGGIVIRASDITDKNYI